MSQTEVRPLERRPPQAPGNGDWALAVSVRFTKAVVFPGGFEALSTEVNQQRPSPVSYDSVVVDSVLLLVVLLMVIVVGDDFGGLLQLCGSFV